MSDFCWYLKEITVLIALIFLKTPHFVKLRIYFVVHLGGMCRLESRLGVVKLFL